MTLPVQNCQTTDYEVRNGLRFVFEMVCAVGVFAGAAWLRHMPVSDPALRIILQLLPAVAAWLILAATVRHYFRLDEFQRLQFLQAVALASGITLSLSWSYPFVRPVFDLPQQTPDHSVPFSIVFIVVTLVLNLRHARARRAA